MEFYEKRESQDFLYIGKLDGCIKVFQSNIDPSGRQWMMHVFE